MPLVTPKVWRLARDDSDQTRRLLLRAWKLILGLIIAVAAIFHAFAGDAFPWMFPFAVAMGIACWMLTLALTQAHYLLMRYCVKRSELPDPSQSPPGR